MIVEPTLRGEDDIVHLMGGNRPRCLRSLKHNGRTYRMTDAPVTCLYCVAGDEVPLNLVARNKVHKLRVDNVEDFGVMCGIGFMWTPQRTLAVVDCEECLMTMRRG